MLMPARPAGAQGRLEGGGSDPHALAAPPARSPTLWAGSGGTAVAGLLARRSDRIGRGRGLGGGALRLQPPAPRAGWEGGGSGCASIGGAGEWGGQEAGGRAELLGGV